MSNNIGMAMYNLYSTCMSSYTKGPFLVCVEDINGELIENTQNSRSSVYGRQLIAHQFLKGYSICYLKLKKSTLVQNLTVLYTQRNAVRRIERYWQKYMKRKRAINVLKPYLMHWAYKPSGVLGRKIISKLCHKNTN